MAKFSEKPLLAKYPQQIKKAEKIYEMFTDHEPSELSIIPMNWPKKQIQIGKGSAIGYRSDKWQKRGDTLDYIHRHDSPAPRVVIERPHDNKRLARLPLLSSRQMIKQPKKPIFAILGHALDFEYVNKDGIVEQIDWKGGPLPLLAQVVSRKNLFIIQPIAGGWPTLVTSPRLIATEAGLEH